MPGCVVPPTDTGVVEVPHEKQDMWIWGHSSLGVEDLISLIFLFRQPQRLIIESLVPALPLVLTHKLSCSSSSIPSWSSMHAVVIEGIKMFSSPLPVPPKELISFHSYAPWISVMPIRSEPRSQAQVSSPTWGIPSWVHYDFLSRVSGIPWCCASCVFLWTCVTSTDSRHLLLSLAHWYEWMACQSMPYHC